MRIWYQTTRRHVENSAFERVFNAQKIDHCSIKMALETKLSIFESDRETGMNDRYNKIAFCINYEPSGDLEKLQWQLKM